MMISGTCDNIINITFTLVYGYIINGLVIMAYYQDKNTHERKITLFFGGYAADIIMSVFQEK